MAAKNCIIYVLDEVWCKISGLSGPDEKLLYEEYAIFADGYLFMPAFKLRRWDGKIRFIDANGKTYVRLLDEIIPKIENMGYSVDLDDKRDPIDPPNTVCTADRFSHIEMKGKPFMIRDYQVDAINSAIAETNGFIIAGTGAGKTTITAGISDIFSKAGIKTLTVVPSDDLVKQTSEWYKMLGMDVGIYSGSQKDLEPMNIVGTWQAIQNNLDLLMQFGCLIWDEAHGAKATVAQKILNEAGKHIAFRFGVTGTLPKSKIDMMSLKASIGLVIKEIPAWWLIENGYLAELKIQPVQITEVKVDEDFPAYGDEKTFVSKSKDRMNKIADIIVTQAATYGNTLVLVNSVEFGKKLSAGIPDSVFLYGKNSSEERFEQYDMFDHVDGKIVIANSQIASTGISIDRVFCLIMIDAGKSFVKAIQSVGRGLRLANDKKHLVVVDIYSKLKWGTKHHKERLKYYKEAKYPVLDPVKIKSLD